jgi:hypothetical protein
MRRRSRASRDAGDCRSKGARRRVAVATAGIALIVGPGTAAAGGFSGATVPGQTAETSKGDQTVMVKVSCPRSTFKGCNGTLSLRTVRKVRGKFRSLGSAKFSIRSGKTSKVKIWVNAEGKKQVRGREISVLANAFSRDGHHRKASHSRKITLDSYTYVNPPPNGGY